MGAKRVVATKDIKDKAGNKVKYSASADYDFGADVKDAIRLHDEAVVHSNYIANGTVRIQAVLRSAIEAEVTKGNTKPEQIQAAATQKMAGYKLGVAIDRTVDIEAAFMAKWTSMTREERAEQLQKMKAAEK